MLTNEQLGELLGVTFSMASRLRSGDRLPGNTTMIRVRDRLGVSLDRQFEARSKGGAVYSELLNEAIEKYVTEHPPAAAPA